MLFGRKKRVEDEAEDLYVSGRYEELLDLIYEKGIQSAKMKRDVAIDYLKKVISAQESAKAYFLLSLLMIPDKSGLEYAIKARDMEPTNREYAGNLALYYSEGMKDNASALATYERFWKETGDVDMGIFVAKWYLRENNLEMAKKVVSNIIIQSPDNKKAKRILDKIEKKAR